MLSYQSIDLDYRKCLRKKSHFRVDIVLYILQDLLLEQGLTSQLLAAHDSHMMSSVI